MCPTLCDPMDCSLPGPSVHGIFQARVLEWGAIAFSGVSSQPRDQTHVSCTGRRILYHWATQEALKWRLRNVTRIIIPNLFVPPLTETPNQWLHWSGSLRPVSQFPTVAPCSKCCSFLHYHSVSVHWLSCALEEQIRVGLVILMTVSKDFYQLSNSFIHSASICWAEQCQCPNSGMQSAGTQCAHFYCFRHLTPWSYCCC